MKLIAPALLFLLVGCEGTHNLSSKDCLPLKVPAQVVLQQETGLYTVRDTPGMILFKLPRDTTNDGFSGIKLVKVVPAGSPLKIEKLTQRWGFDSGLGRISAYGSTPDGSNFEYAWGVSNEIERAPWEPASIVQKRTVECSK